MVRSSNSCSPKRDQGGYILVTLLLFVTIIAIGLVAMAPVISQQMKRDREDELIHRGVQYSRAIQHFVRKFSRYPSRIEELEKTNNMRFLRRRYKDPITGKDFKILHVGDVQTTSNVALQGGIPAANLAAGAAAAGNSLNGNSGFGGNSFGGGSNSFGGGNSGFGNQNSFGGNSGFGNNSFGGQNSFGGGNSGFGGQGAFGSNSPGGNSFGSNSNNSNSNNGGGFFTDPDSQKSNSKGTDQSQNNQNAVTGPGADPTSSNSQVFGGMPIVGVISTSKDHTIRVFNKMDQYYKWQFIYDQSMDQGGLITLPYTGMQTNTRSLQGASPVAPGGTNPQAGGFGNPQGGIFGNQGSPFGSQGGQSGNQGPAVPQPSPYPPMPPKQ